MLVFELDHAMLRPVRTFPLASLVVAVSCDVLPTWMVSGVGVTETVAQSGSEYVDIAVRLASDPAFMARVKQGIRAGLEHSVLTDMRGHTRALEAAYEDALARTHPEALADARR